MPIAEKTVLRYLNSTDSLQLFADIEELHKSQLSAGALAHMPRGFLQRFYRMLANSKDCCVIVILDNSSGGQGRVSGFVSGSIASRSLQKRLFLSAPMATALDFCRLLTQPRLMYRVASISRRMRQIDAATSECQLLSIAVSPEHTRSGLGRKLVAELGEWFVSKGEDSFDLIASETQTAALSFYERLGGRLIGSTDLGGLHSSIFRMPATSGHAERR